MVRIKFLNREMRREKSSASLFNFFHKGQKNERAMGQKTLLYLKQELSPMRAFFIRNRNMVQLTPPPYLQIPVNALDCCEKVI